MKLGIGQEGIREPYLYKIQEIKEEEKLKCCAKSLGNLKCLKCTNYETQLYVIMG